MPEEPQAPRALPVLPLKNVVLFPKLVLPLSVGRDASRAAVDAAIRDHEGEMILVAQKDPGTENPAPGDLHTIATRAKIRKILRTAPNAMELIVSGLERVTIEEFEPGTFLTARFSPRDLVPEHTDEERALRTALFELAAQAVEKINPQSAEQVSVLLANADDPEQNMYLLATAFNLDVEKLQSLLEAPTLAEGLQLAVKHISHEIQILEMRHKIVREAQEEISKEQREYVLRRQMKAIQNELGEDDPEKAEAAELRARFLKADLPDEVRKEAERELNRFERLPGQSPERQVLRTWVELVIELPWRVRTEDNLEIARARKILNDDHYGLDDVKERILEHLGVLHRNPSAKAPILCFVGPPGVGKTSLGQSIARSLGRKFERMSVGGLHDEAELRGHRRTYIGAMAGRLIQAMRRAGANNPVLMLDEIDKLGRDFRGDPAAALLEVLDPEQNSTFRDNYLDMPFDLSKVLFIGTANVLDSIPAPLRDRMEIIELSGYTEEEKLQIARRYLLKRQLLANGLTPETVQVSDEALRRLILDYTREAGVRSLERQIGALLRNAAVAIASGTATTVSIDAGDIEAILGAARFENDVAQRTSVPGVATGLAWTAAGGDILFIESSRIKGTGKLILTGQLGEVMKESAQAAVTLVKSQADRLGIDAAMLDNCDLHIHVPAGAIPKDGPSAGVAIAASLASLLTQRTVRADVAMTGEISLRGVVLPVGGIKEKCVAAARAGIRTVILPARNRRDLDDIPESVRARLEFVWADRIETVFARALEEAPVERAAA